MSHYLSEASIEMGISYLKERNPAVEWIRDLTFAPTEIVRPEVSLNGEVSLKLKLEPSVSFLVYGLAGAKASVAPRGGIVVEAELLPNPHLAGRLEADVSLNFSPDGPALAWLDPKPNLSLNLWEDQWHLFPDEETLAFRSQPEDSTVFEGDSVRFAASVNRSEGVSYRWFFNGTPMPGQTRSYLNLLNVNRYHEGEYFVRATVGKAYVDSGSAMLTVNSTDPPAPSGDLALIPGGPFEMGDTFNEGSSDERPVHMVEVSAFYMDRYEVSKGLWDEVYDWALDHGYTFDNPGQGKAENHPVHSVSWFDGVKWCNARSEMEGRTPAYYTGDSRNEVYRTGRVNVRNAFHGAIRSPTTRQTISAVLAIPMTSAPSEVIIPIITMVNIPTPVRWVRLKRMGMDYTTWPAMSGNGVGIGMDLRIMTHLVRTIQKALILARTVWFAGAVGTPARGSSVLRTGTALDPASGTASLASVLSCLQVSRNGNGAGRSGLRSEG